MSYTMSEVLDVDKLLAEGWVYFDLPKMTVEAFDLFLSIVGEQNVKYLTLAKYTEHNHVRGQILLSPELIAQASKRRGCEAMLAKVLNESVKKAN